MPSLLLSSFEIMRLYSALEITGAVRRSEAWVDKAVTDTIETCVTLLRLVTEQGVSAAFTSRSCDDFFTHIDGTSLH